MGLFKQTDLKILDSIFAKAVLLYAIKFYTLVLQRNYYSPVHSISLHPGKPILIDPQHQLKATSHTLDILRALQRTEANIYSHRNMSLS